MIEMQWKEVWWLVVKKNLESNQTYSSQAISEFQFYLISNWTGLSSFFLVVGNIMFDPV